MLFRNDGTGIEPTIKVQSYTSNLLEHTLVAENDSLVSGQIYRFRLQAVNSVGNSDYSDIVDYALVDVPPKPQSPQVMLSFTNSQ